MQTFIYRAKTIQGQLVAGDLQAEDRPAGVAWLKQKGFFLLALEPEDRLSALWRQKARNFGGRISVRSRAIFTHQLGTLLKAGMPLTMALKTLSTQTENKFLSAVIGQIHRDIEDSCSLSEAMAKHPRVFPGVYTAVITAAEESGALAESLATLSRQLKAQASVFVRIKTAMMYPLFLLSLSAMVVAVLMSFVVPKFLELFVNNHQKLPLPTQILLSLTGFLKAYWWTLPLGGVGLASIGALMLRQERVRLTVDGALLRLPLIGRLVQKWQWARFARTLGSLLDGGVGILSALTITRGVTLNRAFSHDIDQIHQQLTKGAPLARAIRQQPHFNELTANMIAVGEDSGQLPEMLLEVAEMYEQEFEAAVNSITNLLGPIMIVIIGFIIGFVVLAILLPIFETSTMVG